MVVLEVIKIPDPDEWNKLIKRSGSGCIGFVVRYPFKEFGDEVRTQGDENRNEIMGAIRIKLGDIKICW